MEEVVKEGGRRAAEYGGKHLFLGFIPSFLLWNILIIGFVALIFWWLLKSAKKTETALEALKKRYVAGEIDKETFLSLKEDISD